MHKVFPLVVQWLEYESDHVCLNTTQAQTGP